MNVLDIILIAPLLIAVFSGFRKGFIAQLGGVAGLIIGIWLAFRYSDPVGSWLGIDPDIAYYCAFILIVVASIAVMGLVGWFIGKVFHLVGLGLLNRLAGTLLSVAVTVMVLGILLMGFTSINRHTRIVEERHFENSLLYAPIVRLTDAVFPFLEKAFEAIDFNGDDPA